MDAIQTHSAEEHDTTIENAEHVQEMLEKAKADEIKDYKGDPAGQIGTGPFATIDQSGKTYGPYTPQVKTRGTFTGAHPDAPNRGSPAQQAGAWHPGVAEGGLINFYKNGGFSG